MTSAPTRSPFTLNIYSNYTFFLIYSYTCKRLILVVFEHLLAPEFMLSRMHPRLRHLSLPSPSYRLITTR
jgi:hypothetical protein